MARSGRRVDLTGCSANIQSFRPCCSKPFAGLRLRRCIGSGHCPIIGRAPRGQRTLGGSHGLGQLRHARVDNFQPEKEKTCSTAVKGRLAWVPVLYAIVSRFPPFLPVQIILEARNRLRAVKQIFGADHLREYGRMAASGKRFPMKAAER